MPARLHRRSPTPTPAARRRRFTIGKRPAPVIRKHHGEHRAANLLVRLDSASGWTVGQAVSVTVNVSHIYVFDTDGKRIGAAAQSFH